MSDEILRYTDLAAAIQLAKAAGSVLIWRPMFSNPHKQDDAAEYD